MPVVLKRSAVLFLSAMIALPSYGGLSAQELDGASQEDVITVVGSVPADLAGLIEGPELDGIISARNAQKIQILGDDGITTLVDISAATQIRGSGGFLGLNRTKLTADALLNGLPVTVETVEWRGGLVASRIKYKSDDLDTAAMIRGGTAQGFAQQSAATEALRGRMGDIDQYNIKHTANVYFDTAKWALSPEGENELCVTARQAQSMDNALLLVVGYTDSVGDQDYNQILSERRAGRVVNHLQQECGWAPYRMLTPTGMAEAAPVADNETEAGKAQNRRVSVNILVSKALDGL